MKVDVLTVADCPNRAETMARLRDALTSTDTEDAVVTERIIADAAEAATFGMNGSPTILIDGYDPFADEPAEPSMSCRLYRSATGIEGAPSLDALIEALTAPTADDSSAPADCCGDELLAEPNPSPTTSQLAARGFLALWHDTRLAITHLTDDATTVDELVAAGHLELDEDGILIGVHGIVARPTAHRIEHSTGVVNTWCALDAIGIPAALAIDATAFTSCPTCHAELHVTLQHGVPHDDRKRRRLWLPGGRCAHLIDDFCRHANLYCNAEHLDSALPPGSTGRAATVTEAAAIGRTTWRDVSTILHDPQRNRS